MVLPKIKAWKDIVPFRIEKLYRVSANTLIYLLSYQTPKISPNSHSCSCTVIYIQMTCILKNRFQQSSDSILFRVCVMHLKLLFNKPCERAPKKGWIIPDFISDGRSHFTNKYYILIMCYKFNVYRSRVDKKSKHSIC